jgi:hypothetical protein
VPTDEYCPDRSREVLMGRACCNAATRLSNFLGDEDRSLNTDVA